MTVAHAGQRISRTTVVFGTPSARTGRLRPQRRTHRVAGGFTLDGLGGWFVDGVDGDPSAVIGIGLPLTRRLLYDAGLSMADLWAANPLQHASE